METSYLVLDNGISRYEAEHPGVTVNVTTGVLESDYLDYLNDLILRSEPPDVILISSGDILTYVDLGVLAPLSISDTQDYYPSCLQAGILENQLYGLPFEVNPTIMARNDELLSLYNGENLPLDWTTQDFATLSHRLMEEEIIPSYNYTWFDGAYAHGNLLFEEGGTGLFDTPSMERSLSYIYSLNLLTEGHTISRQDFDGGQVAMTPMKYSDYMLYQKYPYNVKNYVDFPLSATSMPGATQENDSRALVDVTLLTMSKFSKNKKEAQNLIQFLSQDPQVQQELFRYSAGVSPVVSVMQSQETLSLLQEIYGTKTGTADQKVLDYMLQHSSPAPKLAQYEDMLLYASAQMNQWVANKEDMGIMTKILQRDIDNMLKK